MTLHVDKEQHSAVPGLPSRQGITSRATQPRRRPTTSDTQEPTSTMAAWQFDLLFVPTGPVAHILSDDGWAFPLVDEPLVVDAHQHLSEAFGPPWHMCEGVLVFGAEHGCRIDVVIDADGDAEISARVDSRSDAECFLELIVELASRLDCRLFSPEHGRLLEPDRKTLADALATSSAWTYALDPTAAIRRLDQ